MDEPKFFGSASDDGPERELNLAGLRRGWYYGGMASKLTSEQRLDLQQHGNKPVPVVDPETKAVYFLFASDLFERVRGVIAADELDIRETYAAQSAIAAQAGWDDPEMDAYNDYDAHKPRS